MKIHMDEVARHRSWDADTVDYAYSSIEGFADSAKPDQIDAWARGLEQRGWDAKEATAFASALRKKLASRIKARR
ncbi:hypothetical protein [Deinococcus ruber]|uniref:Uncharacterized protein n=1 Tax=Deinococcus ruber TaxID=1848197 RepID=A0A918CCH5_9DEIO|nr:hypothetical protein [Deinococcus ruber]GGR16687.1 hypothetical protein GCM10008957_31660 [Deinococcus ruber]